ncbi:hypothetical protein [Oceanobacillus limi]|uniref:hypothetical protein n=1 Tax=Oceanobacillus limi TaxID=930131 RepID=UPI00147D53D1|nr:hypothetical protein [Oceanobacillus limi]
MDEDVIKALKAQKKVQNKVIEQSVSITIKRTLRLSHGALKRLRPYETTASDRLYQ